MRKSLTRLSVRACIPRPVQATRCCEKREAVVFRPSTAPVAIRPSGDVEGSIAICCSTTSAGSQRRGGYSTAALSESTTSATPRGSRSRPATSGAPPLWGLRDSASCTTALQHPRRDRPAARWQASESANRYLRLNAFQKMQVRRSCSHSERPHAALRKVWIERAVRARTWPPRSPNRSTFPRSTHPGIGLSRVLWRRDRDR